VLSRLHWVRPELVAEVTYLTWTADGLLRHVVYEGLREDKSPREVRRRPVCGLLGTGLPKVRGRQSDLPAKPR
jgi:ATP dependent DNA ligase C terminal region